MRKNDTANNKLKHSTLMIGPKVGETVTGVSVAFDMLSEYLTQHGGRVGEVNLTQPRTTRFAGRFSFTRATFVLRRIFEAWCKMIFHTVVYLPVSSSPSGFARDFLLIAVASLIRCKIILHLHGGGYKAFYEDSSSIMKWIIRWTLRRATRIIVLGELLKDQFSFLDNPNLLRVVPNGLPFEIESKISPPKASNPPKIWRFLFLSNLMESKGYFLLLEAAELLLKKGLSNFQIDFCGDFVTSIAEQQTSRELEFRARISDDDLKTHVFYHGTVSGKQKEDFLVKSHFLVLPTTYPWEGQPLSIIEALAVGTPVISTNHAGIAEQVENNYNGWLLQVENLTSEVLSNCLVQAMTISSDRYSEMCNNSLAAYRRKFTKQQHLANMLSVINVD